MAQPWFNRLNRPPLERPWESCRFSFHLTQPDQLLTTSPKDNLFGQLWLAFFGEVFSLTTVANIVPFPNDPRQWLVSTRGHCVPPSIICRSCPAGGRLSTVIGVEAAQLFFFPFANRLTNRLLRLASVHQETGLCPAKSTSLTAAQDRAQPLCGFVHPVSLEGWRNLLFNLLLRSNLNRSPEQNSRFVLLVLVMFGCSSIFTTVPCFFPSPGFRYGPSQSQFCYRRQRFKAAEYRQSHGRKHNQNGSWSGER